MIQLKSDLIESDLIESDLIESNSIYSYPINVIIEKWNGAQCEKDQCCYLNIVYYFMYGVNMEVYWYSYIILRILFGKAYFKILVNCTMAVGLSCFPR